MHVRFDSDKPWNTLETSQQRGDDKHCSWNGISFSDSHWKYMYNSYQNNWSLGEVLCVFLICYKFISLFFLFFYLFQFMFYWVLILTDYKVAINWNTHFYNNNKHNYDINHLNYTYFLSKVGVAYTIWNILQLLRVYRNLYATFLSFSSFKSEMLMEQN